jgi:hypothetical protein
MVQSNTVNADIYVQGSIPGQFIVGNYNLQIQSSPGAVINVARPLDQPAYKMRATPIDLRPVSFPSLLDRENEATSIKETIKTYTPVSIYGKEGVGKTSLIRKLANLPDVAGFPDGVIHVDAMRLGLDDLLQRLFDSFYESFPEFKPTNTEIRIALQKPRAVIFLDNLNLQRDEVVSVLDAARNCVFVFSSVERSLWGEGRIVFLQGLPEKEALALFERELGYPMSEEENKAAKEICTHLQGHPLQILQAASLVHEKSMPIGKVLEQLEGKDPDHSLNQVTLPTVSENQKQILIILGAVGGNVMPLEHLVSLSKDPNTRTDLQNLIALGLIQAHSPRYSLTGNLASFLPTVWDLSSADDMLLNYFVGWLEGQPAQSLIEESAEALIHTVRQAAEKQRWSSVIRLGRALEHSLILWKRWQAWSDILNLILRAAQTLGDRKVEAWAIHQLGSRAMCLGQMDQARELLTQALNIRKVIKDKEGLKVTQHNLDVLLRAPIPPKGGKSGGRSWFSGASRFLISLLMSALIPYVLLSLFVPPGWFPFPVLPIYLFPAVTPAPEDTLTPAPTEIPVASEAPVISDIEGPQIADYYREPDSNWVCLEENDSVTVHSTITDPSGVAGGVVEYQFNDAGSEARELQREGDVFTAIIDNLQEGLLTFKISATDDGGNSSSLEGQSLSVFRCDGLEPRKDLRGLDFPDTGASVGTNNLWGCHQSCQDNQKCMAFTYAPADGACWLEYGLSEPADNSDLISGVVRTSIPTIEIVVGASESPDRVMLYQGEEQDFFQVPVLITLTNQSDLDVNEFDISMNYDAYDGSHATRLMDNGQTLYQDSVHIPLLSVGEVISFESKAMVPRSYEGTTVELKVTTDRCEIDVECQIRVYPVQLPTVVYDFIDNAPAAEWHGSTPSGSYNLEFKRLSEECSHGLAHLSNGEVLEDGSQPAVVLYTHPPCEGGTLDGIYELGPEVDIYDPSNLFVARLGFTTGGYGDGVTFTVLCYSLVPSSEFPDEILTVHDSSDGYIKDVVIPLSIYLKECRRFQLFVDAGPTPDYDWAVWVAAYIERP